MRLRLLLRPRETPVKLPINYSYLLGAAIYKVLGQASASYADFLHEQGYRSGNDRLLKMFTFSKLLNPYARPRKTPTLTQLVSPKGSWTLYIGSPMSEDFVQNFVLGLFESSELAIGALGLHAAFQVETVEALPLPELQPPARFQCLSPFSVSRTVERGGRLLPEYLLPTDPGLSAALRNNLLEKHKIIHGELPRERELELRFDKRDRPKTRLITLKEGTPQETKRRAIESHFTLAGSQDLAQTAWECGLGEANSMGFGMIGVVDSG